MTSSDAEVRQQIVEAIETHREQICSASIELQFQQAPELAEKYGARGMEYCKGDCAHHLDYLVQAISANEAKLFTDYVGWAQSMLTAYNVQTEDLVAHLECLEKAIADVLPGQAAVECLNGFVKPPIAMLRGELPKYESFISTTAPHAELASEYLQALLDGRRQDAAKRVLDAVGSGVPVKEIYSHVFQPAQYEIGRLWQLNEISIAQEHYCTAATQLVMSQLYTHIFQVPRNGRTIVTACVAGELHELGIRMVSDFFEMDGWDSFYLGASTPTATIVKTLQDRHADVLAISTTITTHVKHVKAIIQEVRKTPGLRVKILVGGYPFNLAPELYREVGADAFARNAEEAVTMANQLVSETYAK